MIELIKAFPYDNSYDYVKMFSSKAEQDTYFNTLSKISIDDHNYIKIENSFNVNYDYEYLENEGVNYIIFDNGYRDIYAFIIKKEFVRNTVTRLIYEVDVMQTYMMNFSLSKSFVERKKCTIDEVTNFDEGLNIGEHKIVSETVAFSKGSVYFAMFGGMKNFEVTMQEDGKITHYAEIPSSQQKPLTKIDGINYPLFFMPLPTGNIPTMISDHPSLMGVVRFPTCTYDTDTINIPCLLKTQDIGLGKPVYTTFEYVASIAKNISSVTHSGSGGSVPKAETTDFFPYTYYVLTDGESEPLVMKPQELTGLSVVGKYALSHQPIERFYVQGYKGDSNGRAYNITNTNQMMLPTATSEGMAYIAANGGNLKMQRDNQVMDNVLGAVTTIGSAIATSGASLLMGGLGSTASGINQVRQADQRNESMMLTPNSISSYGTPSTRNAFDTDNVRVLKYSVSENVKNKIRAYIERYGNSFNNYATIDLKTYKGYIKFISPDIDSTIDNMYINRIKGILEGGVYIE
jgi:hypothetical protein